ncbi:MAG: hypothetical protein IPJ45_14180 [Ignavibacteria bacterium]|nr:hypothetical protein [Ignavibacteria bacterium]
MLDRKYLYARINARTDEMISNGLLNEVKFLKRIIMITENLIHSIQ